ncbi:MAG: hypothetical protein ACRDRN_17460 [Sciscionella sp.]
MTSDLYWTWYRCVTDGCDHAVTDEEFARGVREETGTYVSVCGHRVLIGSMLARPGPPCVRCHKYLLAQRTLRGAGERLGEPRHGKPGLLRRVFRRLKPPGVSGPDGDGRAPIPAVAGRAAVAPALAGRHAARGAR